MGTRTKLRQSDLVRGRVGQQAALNAPLDAGEARMQAMEVRSDREGTARDERAKAAYKSQVESDGPEFRFKKVGDAWAISAWDAPNAKMGDRVTIRLRSGEQKEATLGALVSEDRRLRIFADASSKPKQPRQTLKFRDDVPEGRYALTGDDGSTDFYKVDRPTEGRWAGYVFVKLVVGGDQREQRLQMNQQATVLDRIAEAGIQQAMVRYGQEIGECGHCGRTLTDEASRAKGIGPVCEANLGW